MTSLCSDTAMAETAALVYFTASFAVLASPAGFVFLLTSASFLESVLLTCFAASFFYLVIFCFDLSSLTMFHVHKDGN